MTRPKSQRYRIDPDFVRPTPSAATMFAHLAPDKISPGARDERIRSMLEAGAQFFRFTLVDAANPHPPYPDGLWFEGWLEPNPVPIEFGASEKPGGAIWPPLTARGSA